MSPTKILKRTLWITLLPLDEGKSGIARYIYEVTKALQLELKDSDEIELGYIYLENEENLLEENIGDIKNSSKQIKLNKALGKPILSMMWHFTVLTFLVISKSKDYFFLPAGNRRLSCTISSRVLSTYHDISQLHVKNKYDSFRTIYALRVLPFIAALQKKIIVVSESTKRDLVEWAGIKKEKIKVVYNGYNSIDMKEEQPKWFDSSKQYLLYVSRIEHPGKNHMNLIKALECLNEEGTEYNLICIGAAKEGSEIVFDYLESSSAKGRILFPGYCSDAELKYLYTHCEALVFPSLYEGFGFPIVESFAHELPVICANTSSLPEVGGDVAEYFDPSVPEDIADKIQKLETIDPSILKEKKQAGLERLKLFTWENHAKEVLRIIKN